MPLVIRAVTLSGAALTQPLSGRFDERGGTLGRADDNTLTLPDPKRHISRQQAEVSCGAQGYAISNIGSANPIIVNGRSLAPGESAALADGDELQIGAYRLRVIEDDDDATLPTIARAPAKPRPGGFAGAPEVPRAQHVTADASTGGLIELLRPVGAPQPGCIDRLVGGARGGDAMERFMKAGAGQAADRRADVAMPKPEPPREAPALLRPRAEPAPEAAFVDRTPEQHAAMPLPPRPAADVDLDITAPAVLPPPAPRATNGDPLWAAFCEGTGVALAAPQGLNPELMRTLGRLMRNLVAGTVELVKLRAETKNELHFPATMLRTQGNNPLRFSGNVHAALTQLLQPPLSGFMAGPEATQEAMDDLFAHAIGTMTGMRAAIEGVLARFEPPRLEAQLVGGEVLDKLLPMHRSARLWGCYLEHFDAVRGEAQEDFDRLFGRAFMKAYDAQLDRLDAERRARRAKAAP